MVKNVRYCECGCNSIVERGNRFVHGHNRAGLCSYSTKDRWAIKYDSCIVCGTTNKKHAGNGLCGGCYKKNFYELAKTKLKWSNKYDSCIDCGRIDRPHQANGRCGTCHVNNINRLNGVKKRNIGGWSWYYDRCIACGTIDRGHAGHGLCVDCMEELKRENKTTQTCPVCGVKVNSLNRHLSMRSKKCEKHYDYQFNIFENYFKSELSLEAISKECNIDRHSISEQFVRFFGKEETKERNKHAKSAVCSSRAKIGFNSNNKYGTVCYYDSLKNGTVRFRSKLEKAYAMYLDSKGIDWLYEPNRFKYKDETGKERTYTPDFYLPLTDNYIEVKGFKKENDDYKIKCLVDMGVSIETIFAKDIKHMTALEETT